MSSELTKKTTKFSENVLDATNDFELIIEDESKLAEINVDHLKRHRCRSRKR